MTLRWLAITCDAQRLLTKSQMWGKLWHATVQAGGWVGVRSGREKHLPGKTPQTAPAGTGPKRRQRRHQSRSSSHGGARVAVSGG